MELDVTDTSIPSEKIEAYRATHFSVCTAGEAFTLMIDVPSVRLQELYLATNTTTALFITAFNPFGQVQSEEANIAAHIALGKKLRALSKHVYGGNGGDPNGSWPKEESYLVLGVEYGTAKLIGAGVLQDAVVWAGSDGIPELILLR